jgi:exodeoxyribonuclease VII small subunit
MMRAAEAGAGSADTDGPRASSAGGLANVASLCFEDALAELERIVRALEGGQQKLEDAITAYERGAALRKHCEAKLAEAEARVAAIVELPEGRIGLRPLE